MNNIKLTEDHKVKLLEMCNELFPKYVSITIGDQYSEADTSFCQEDLDEPHPLGYGFNAANCGNILFFCVEKTKNVAYGKKIHWFEFCITEIVNQLSWKNIKTDILADCEYEDFRMKLINEIFRDKFTTERFHIVDYLYEEFKKLKNE